MMFIYCASGVFILLASLAGFIGDDSEKAWPPLMAMGVAFLWVSVGIGIGAFK